MFGDQLKKYRTLADLSQKELASKLFVTQQAVGRWETNTTSPKPEMIVKIAEILDVPAGELLGDAQTTTDGSGIKIPVLGDVAAGIPIEAVQNIVDYEEIDAATAASGDFFALRIRGNSMEPRIRPGDVVIVRKQPSADTGDTAIVLVNGDSATCKRIKLEDDGSLWLIPNNPAYSPLHFSPAEIQTMPVTILGKVVELRAKF